MPWPASARMDQTSTSLTTLRDRNFLANARAQLDADHYGLDKIKKRLIEYLAVVRLKQLQAEQETSSKEAMTASASGNDSATEASPQDAENNSKAVSVRTNAPTVDQQKPKRGTATKAVKGPILL